MDEGEDAGADKKTENNQSTNGIGDEADDENKNKNKKQNKNKDNDNQEAHFNKRTEKIISTEDNKEAINSESGLLQHANRLHANGAAAAWRSEEEEKLAQSTKEVVTAVTNNDQGPTIDDGWNEEDDEYFISDDETVGEKGKNTEETETGEADGDIRNTSTMDNTGATEDDSTSTVGDDGVGNKDNGFILVEEGKEVGEGKNTEAAVEDEEDKNLGATGATGATGGREEDSNRTISIDAAQNEKEGVILEEGEIVYGDKGNKQ